MIGIGLPLNSLRLKPQYRNGLRLFVGAPFMVARQAGASLAGSRKRVPGRPTCRAAALIGLSAVVLENRTCLEAAMATTSPAHAAVQPTAFSTAPSLDAKSFQGLSKEHCFCPDWLHKNRWGYPIATNGKGGKSGGHRLAYRLFIGPIPHGTLVLHRCGNPACINPHHLYLGNAQQNALDRQMHGNTLNSVRLPQTKLTDQDVLAIRASSDGCTALAKRYGMSRSYIWCIRNGYARNAVKVEG